MFAASHVNVKSPSSVSSDPPADDDEVQSNDRLRCPKCLVKFMSVKMVNVHVKNCGIWIDEYEEEQGDEDAENVQTAGGREEDEDVQLLEQEHQQFENETHVQTPHSAGNFACEICDQSFKSPRGVRIHKSWRHKGKQNVLFKCRYCPREFKAKAQLQQHERGEARRIYNEQIGKTRQQFKVYNQQQMKANGQRKVSPKEDALFNDSYFSSRSKSPAFEMNNGMKGRRGGAALPVNRLPSSLSAHSQAQSRASSAGHKSQSSRSMTPRRQQQNNNSANKMPRGSGRASHVKENKSGRGETPMVSPAKGNGQAGRAQDIFPRAVGRPQQQQMIQSNPYQQQPAADVNLGMMTSAGAFGNGSAVVSHYAGMVINACAQSNLVTFHDVDTSRGTIGKITFQFMCNKCHGQLGVARCYRGRAYCIMCCGHPECD